METTTKYDKKKAFLGCCALEGLASLFDGYLQTKGDCEIFFTTRKLESIGAILELIHDAIDQDDMLG